MPRTNRVPKYSHHKGSGQAMVRIEGKTYYLGKHDTDASKSLYRELIERWQARHASPQFLYVTVAHLAVAYMGHVASYYVKDGKQTSEVHCVRNSLRELVKIYRNLQLRDFSPLKLKAVREAIIDTGCSRGTVNARTQCIIRAFRWAVAQEMVSPTVITGLECVEPLKRGRTRAPDHPPIKPVRDAQIDATLPHLPDNARDAVMLQRVTGARAGELLIMRPRDLTMTGEVWEYRPATHKTEHHGRQRVIPIGPQGQAIVRGRMTDDPGVYLFRPRGSRRRSYSVAAYRKAIQRACEVAFDMPKHLRRSRFDPEAAAWRAEHVWHPHQLRHSFGTLARREAGIEVARTVLGHSSTVTTEIYAEKDLEAAKALIARIG